MNARKAVLGWIATCAVAFALTPAARAVGIDNIDPAGDGHKYAWGENIGWVNAKPAGTGGPGLVVGDRKLTGFMWGENIGWINMSCENGSVCDTTRYGVENDGFGALSGFAWSENAGWINFHPATCAGDPTCGVRIDPATGYFSGRAWGENIGWITFASSGPQEWTTRTSWCQGISAPPETRPVLHVSRPVGDPDVRLEWEPVEGASSYDVVMGSLSALARSGGDFQAATFQCLASGSAATSVVLPPLPAKPADGTWFLLRGANCRGRGTYDDDSPSQAGPRDPGIAASGRDCL
jgi:hypothetical protein